MLLVDQFLGSSTFSVPPTLDAGPQSEAMCRASTVEVGNLEMRFQHMDLGVKNPFLVCWIHLDFFPNKNVSVSLLSVFLGLLDQVVNPAHGPLQALLGVDGGGLQFLPVKRMEQRDLETSQHFISHWNHQQFFWVISGHILLFFLNKDSEIGSNGIPSNQSDWYGIEFFCWLDAQLWRCLAGAAAATSRRRSTARWGQAGGKEGPLGWTLSWFWSKFSRLRYEVPIGLFWLFQRVG